MSDYEPPKRVRTWQELEDWFSGAADGHAVFYSPDVSDDWDTLWLKLGDEAEVGRGMRSFSLSGEDARWLHEVLSRYFSAAVGPGEEAAQ